MPAGNKAGEANLEVTLVARFLWHVPLVSNDRELAQYACSVGVDPLRQGMATKEYFEVMFQQEPFHGFGILNYLEF